jgi:hypothetical protein
MKEQAYRGVGNEKGRRTHKEGKLIMVTIGGEKQMNDIQSNAMINFNVLVFVTFQCT